MTDFVSKIEFSVLGCRIVEIVFFLKKKKTQAVALIKRNNTQQAIV